MTKFNTTFTSRDTSRRGPSNHNRNNFRKQLIDVFGKQTQNGEFLALDKPTCKVWFGLDEFGWPYARITGNLSGWKFNDKPITSERVYLNVSASSGSDELTHKEFDSRYTFQRRGRDGVECFYVCWMSLKAGNPGINPLVFP